MSALRSRRGTDSAPGPLEVQRIGDDRVRIRSNDEPTAEAIVGWLAAQEVVVKVRWHKNTGAIDVRYREPDERAGAFLRTLRDRVFTVTRSRPPRAEFRVVIAHILEGRVRLRLDGASDDQLVRLASWVGALPGIVRASGSPASQSILVQFDPAVTSGDALLAAIEASNPSTWPDAPPPGRSEWAATTFNTAVLAVTMSGALPMAALAPAVALTALPSARRAFRALRERRLGVDMLDLAAIGISLGTGQPQTAAFITWLLGAGDLVLERTADRARTAISKLMKLDAESAWRIRASGEVEKVSVKRLVAGDRVVVEAGGRIPADGVIASGEASVDEKALTGESLPRARRPGERVLAATVVVEGQVIVAVDRVGTDTTAAKIIQILEGAGAKPMTLQRETERVADRLVLPTFGVAGAAAALTSQIDRMTSVLITDFGTGIRIAVPTSALTGMTLAARRGVLVKGAQYLERLAKADVVVFDKTGTLTAGTPEVIDVVGVNGSDAHAAFAAAAAAEQRQGHPIAEAIRRYAHAAHISVPKTDLGSEIYTIGVGLSARVDGREILVGGRRLMEARGISTSPARDAVAGHHARGASSIYVAIEGELAAVIAYADAPRPESAEVVRQLRAGGRRQIVVMSGDARAAVEAVGRTVGADHTHAELLPEDKARCVRDLQRQGHVVAMIGDGINDAPALAVADVGVSLHGGTDVALETADVVLLEGGLARLPHAFEVADDAMRRVRRGLGLVIAPNAIAIGLGALGLITPGLAAVINNGSTVVAALAAVAPLVRKSKP